MLFGPEHIMNLPPTVIFVILIWLINSQFAVCRTKSCQRNHKFLMSHFRTIISLFGSLINDLITVPKSYWTRFVSSSPFACLFFGCSCIRSLRKQKSWINFYTGVSLALSLKHRGFIIQKNTNLKFIYLNLNMSKTAPTAATHSNLWETDWLQSRLTKSRMQIECALPCWDATHKLIAF